MLKDLYSLSKPGIYALVNHKNKRIYIGYSRTSMLSSVSRIAYELEQGYYSIKQMQQDKHKLKLLILDSSVPDEYMKIYTEWYCYKWYRMGYDLYTSYKPLGSKFRVSLAPGLKLLVEIVYRGNTSVTAGICSSQDEVNTFIKYVGDGFMFPVSIWKGRSC